MRAWINNHPAKDAGNQSDYISSYRKRTLAVASLVPANVVYWGVTAIGWAMHARHRH